MGSLTYANVLRVLTHQISREWQLTLGTRYVTGSGAGRQERLISRRPIENMLNRIGQGLAHLETATPGLDTKERTYREALLTSITNRLLDASKPYDLPPTGHYALDATGVWAWSRAGGQDSTTSRDPDARWGYKTAKTGQKQIFFGYDAYAWVRVQPVGDAQPYPHLIERLLLRPAASDEPDSTLPMIEAMQSGPYRIQTLITDRAWSYKVGERWALPLLQLGIEQVVDLHENDYGVRDHEGLRVVAGWPHCPAMPDRLIDITRPARFALSDASAVGDNPQTEEPTTVIETREFLTRIEERKPYALRRVAGPDNKGNERYECPANAGQCRCPLKAMSMHLPVELPLVTDPPAEQGRPRICQQRTVSLPGTVTPKVRQRLYWGSEEWIRSFARRTHVEGAFGNIKNRNTENISRGWLQVSGHARTTLMLTLAAVAYNLRIARKWNAETGASEDPLLQPDPAFHGWRELTADEVANLPHAA